MNQTFELFLSGSETVHRYKISTLGLNGEGPVEDFFELRSDSVELTMTFGALAKAASNGKKPEQELHLAFGKRIYNLLFGGAVGECWQERRKRAGRNPLALVLRIDPKSARFLQRIPWEYLHDGKDFLSTNWRTPVYRLPPDVEPVDFERLREPLRMLVVIAAPLGLNENEVLHFAREEDLILAATSGARKTGKLWLEFTPNSALETVEEYLREYRPHLLHFVGHGVFVDSADSGLLLMETPDGHRREVWNHEFAELLIKTGCELRGVFLSACQSAVAPRAEGFADLASHLLKEGIPAVAAMQYSVLDTSAMTFGSAFYKGIAEGQLVQDAFTEARGALKNTSPNNVDFATPVLFLADPDCLHVDLEPRQAIQTPLDLSGLTKAQNFVGRAVEIRELQSRLDPQIGTWRAVVIHAIGGMGKTVLAARLAERMAPRLDGVVSLRMTPTTTAQNVIDLISDFLIVHNAHFNLSEIHKYQQTRSEPLEPRIRAGALAQILRQLRLLVIFDNCEDILPDGKEVSRGVSLEQSPSLDPELMPLIAALVGSIDGPSRFLFTSRVDFSPLEDNRLLNAIGHLSLKEMGFSEAVYLMDTLPPLANLPVAILSHVQVNSNPGPHPITMKDVYERLGGHPYSLSLFAKHAGRTSIAQVLDDLSEVQQELLEFTLVEKAVEQLSERSALLLRRAAVFEEPVPIEGLAFILGDGQDAMPEVTDELNSLLNWGLVARELGTEYYSLQSIARDWAQRKWNAIERKECLQRAARYWLGAAKDSHILWGFLYARQYLYKAGEFEDANKIVERIVQVLLRWGHVGLALTLVRQGVETLKGKSQSYALGNLATIYFGLGDYASAQKHFEQVLDVAKAMADNDSISNALYYIGAINSNQGDYPRALEFFEQALKIQEEMGDRAGVAASLNQIGVVYYCQADYEKALEFYQQSLKVKEEIGDQVGIAVSLFYIASLDEKQGNYPRALEFCQQSLKIFEEVGDRGYIASNLLQIGILFADQGDYPRALEFYQYSMKVFEEIGGRAGSASSLHNIGRLHEHQGNYTQALRLHRQALKIREELGDRAGVASSLNQIGAVYHGQGDYKKALEFYQQSLKVKDEIGDRAGIAISLANFGLLDENQGNYPRALELHQQSLKIKEEINDRGGIAKTLNQIAAVYDHQGDFLRALEFCQQSLKIFEEIGDREGMALNYMQIGEVFEHQGNYPRALEFFEQSLKSFEAIGNQAGMATSLNQIGAIYRHQGNYTQALRLHHQALKIREELGDGDGVARDLNQIAEANRDQGDHKKAFEFYQKSLKTFEEIGDRGNAAKSLNQIGALHYQLGNYPRALEFSQQSLKIFEEIGDRAGVATNLSQMGVLHGSQGNDVRALEFYQQALKIFEEIGDRKGVANNLLGNIGVLYYDQKDYPQALEFFKQALTIFEEIGDRGGVAKSLNQTGIVYRFQSDYPRALEFFQQSLKIFEEIGDRAGVATNLSQIGSVYHSQGDGLKAFEFHQQALKISEEIGDREGVANSLGEIGLLCEENNQLEMAIKALTRAFLLFAGIDMPKARIARNALRRLQAKVGKEIFDAAIHSLGVSAEIQSIVVRALENSPAQADFDEQNPREVLIQNTILVLTSQPDKKGEWWASLRNVAKQAKEQAEQNLAVYVNALLRLVEGAKPDSLTAGIPDEFKPDWQAILDGISKKE
jgi:tetratricopeptide (TPR) repeat protein